MDNSLVGRKFRWTWQTGIPNQATFEVEFISDTQKTSKAIEGLEYEATHTYDSAIVAPNVFIVSWLEEQGAVLTIVINLNDMKIYGSFSDTSPMRIFMTGIIKEI